MAMAALLWVGLTRRDVPSRPAVSESPSDDAAASPSGQPPEHPSETCVRTLLDSARRGDVAAYLGAFTGELRKRLDREVAERGREAFAADLTAASRLRKSHAVFSAVGVGPEAAQVMVESVYADRNERQNYRVENVDGEWRVTLVETVRSVQPGAKFGSLATFEAPEGVPVQGEGPVQPGEEVDPATGKVVR